MKFLYVIFDIIKNEFILIILYLYVIIVNDYKLIQ